MRIHLISQLLLKPIILLSFFIFLPACALNPFVTPSLYQRLGELAGIEAVVNDFSKQLQQDKRINGFFVDVEWTEFKNHLSNMICHASGGHCIYLGRDMKSLHQGMQIQKSDFTALVEDLIITLDKFAVPEQEKNELLALLGPMQPDIVEPLQESSKLTNDETLALEEAVEKMHLKANEFRNHSGTPIKKLTVIPAQQPSKEKLSTVITNQSSHSKASHLDKAKTEKLLITKQKRPSPIKQAIKPAVKTKLKAKLTSVYGQVQLMGKNANLLARHQSIVILEAIKPSIYSSQKSNRTHVAIMNNKRYHPSYLTIQRNDKVAFHNLDKFKHNVFSSSQGSRFDLGAFASGKRPDVQLKNNGIIKVYCDIHPKMAMFIQVTDSPFHTTTKLNGNFQFQNVPLGTYKLKVWNIRGHSEKKIVVTRKGLKNLVITLNTSNYKRELHQNKKGKAYSKRKIKDAFSDEEFF